MFLLLISLASGFLIGILGITYKLASKHNCDADNFRAALMWMAAFLATVAAIAAGESAPRGTLLAFGALCGVCFFLALVSVMRAMEIGSVSFSWVLINLSIVIPILASAVIWSEPVRPVHWAGIGFFAVSLVLFGRDLAGSEQKRISPQWVGAAILMFVTNGTVLLLFKVIDKRTAAPHTFVTLCTMYVVGALLLAIRRRGISLPRSGELKLGAVAAASMMGGQALIMKAQAINTASALPIIHGVSIIVVAGASAIWFGEKFTWFSGSGLVAGLISIVLLTLG